MYLVKFKILFEWCAEYLSLNYQNNTESDWLNVGYVQLNLFKCDFGDKQPLPILTYHLFY